MRCGAGSRPLLPNAMTVVSDVLWLMSRWTLDAKMYAAPNFPIRTEIFPVGFLSDAVYSLSFRQSTSLNHRFLLQLCARRAIWTKEQEAIVNITRDKRWTNVKLYDVDVMAAPIDTSPTCNGISKDLFLVDMASISVTHFPPLLCQSFLGSIKYSLRPEI